MSRDFLMSNVDCEEIVQNDDSCKNLLIEAMKYHLMPEKRNQFQSVRTRERKSPSFRPMIFAIGENWSPFRGHLSYFLLWDKMLQRQSAFHFSSGGSSLFSVHNECEYYDPVSDQWLQTAPMTCRRSRCGVVVVLGKLYAIGG